MTEDGIKLTPLAGRVVIHKREAVTGSIFLAILISIFILVLIQALNVLFLRGIPALFWSLTALLVLADAAACALIFRRAITAAQTNSSAPPYTIAYRQDGVVVLCHKNGEREYFPAAEVTDIRGTRTRFAFILNGWAYSGNSNYGKVTFFLTHDGKTVKKSVKYVANCVQAAEFIRHAFLTHGGAEGGVADGASAAG